MENRPRDRGNANSPYDPDARYGNKRSKTWSGYKLHLTETCDEDLPRIATRVQSTPAHLSDVAQTQKVHKDLHRRGLLPKEHVADAGFVDADLLVKSALEHGIDLTGPVRPDVSWQARTEGAYDISRFTVDWEHKKATCPEGKAEQILETGRRRMGQCRHRGEILQQGLPGVQKPGSMHPLQRQVSLPDIAT